LKHEPLNSKCLKYILNKVLSKRKTWQIINIVGNEWYARVIGYVICPGRNSS